MAAFVAWGRIVLVGPDGVPLGAWVVGGAPGEAPGLDAVDALARWQLAARRAGGWIRLSAVSPELAELLDLAGLLDLKGLGGEVGGQPEGGEEVGVQEGVEAGDPPV